jgi:hypothetical protein
MRKKFLAGVAAIGVMSLSGFGAISAFSQGSFEPGDRVITPDGGGEVALVMESGRRIVGLDENREVRHYALSELDAETPTPTPTPSPTPTPTPEPTADLYLSPSGSDSNSCTQAQPCRNMQRAYNLADAGDRVQMAAGNYGTQNLNRNPAKDAFTQHVHFEANGDANVGSLNFGATYDTEGARHVLVRGVDSEWVNLRRSVDITIHDMHTHGVHTAGAVDTAFIDGEWEKQADPDGGHPEFTRYRTSTNTTDVLIQGIHIHHIGRPLGREDVHTNCLHFWGGAPRRITIRGNTFDHCDVFASLLHNTGDVLIEDNDFGPSTNTGFTGSGFYSLYIGPSTSTPFRVRNNIFRMQPTNNAPSGVVQACGNTGQLGSDNQSWAQPC